MTLRTVKQIVPRQKTTEGAGVRLFRTIGSRALDHVDPFLLLDEFKSEEGADYIAGFPDHPHRGFETVTYMLAGAMLHKDHMGNEGNLKAGSVQWMTAGRGVVHSEMPQQENGLLWGFQLWINLPAKDKLCAARYQDIPPEEIPEVDLANGVRVRVLAGRAAEATGAVTEIVTDPLYLDVRVPETADFQTDVPIGHSAFVYVFEGSAAIGDAVLPCGSLAVLNDGDSVRVSAADGGHTRYLLAAARPLGEPIARYGPFVMNTADEIEQAISDFQGGRLTD
jgi:quercetin 2,3-dioxygenase